MPPRQKLDTLEAKPKRVRSLPTIFDPGDLLKDLSIARAVTAIRRAIEGGAPLPTGCYRKGVGTTPDGLLTTLGIMHLHLGRPNTDELLYLVQYPDDVVFLELSDHSHFATRPVGSRLTATHGAAVAAAEAAIDAAPKPKRAPWSMKKRTGSVPTKPPAAAPEVATAPETKDKPSEAEP